MGGSVHRRRVKEIPGVWKELVAQRRFIVASVFMSGILFTVAAFLLPRRYTAVTTLIQPQRNDSFSSLVNAQLGGLGSLGSLAGRELNLRDPNSLYIGVLRSRSVEDALVHAFHLTELYRKKKESQARKVLEERTEIASTKYGLLRISVEDEDPNRAAALANAYVSEFQQSMLRAVSADASQRRTFFEQQLIDAQSRLINAQEQLKHVEQQTGILQLDAQTRAVIGSVAQIKAQVASKEVELQVLSTSTTTNNPRYVLAEKELSSLKEQLNAVQAGKTGGPLVGTSQIPAAGMSYLNKLRDVRYYESISDLLAKQLDAARLDEARQGKVLQVLDGAVAPDTASSPSRALIIGFGLALGLFSACSYVIARRTFILPNDRSQLSPIAEEHGRPSL